MRDVVVADVMEEEPSHPPKKRSVDGTNCASEEGPFSLPIMRNGGIGMMEEGEHHNPMVDELIKRRKLNTILRLWMWQG